MDWVVPILLPYLTLLAEAVIILGVGYALKFLKKRTGVEVEATLARRLHETLFRGAVVAIDKLGTEAAERLAPLEFEKRTLRMAAEYARRYSPDIIAQLNLGPDALAELIRPHIPVAKRVVVDGMVVVPETQPWQK